MTNAEQQLQNEIIQSVDVDASLLPQTSFDVFKQKLSAYINELINHNFEKLVQILYRLDICEQKLKKFLSTQQADAGELIASLIIERQLQKIKTREQFKQQNNIDDGEERW